jgi:hypothetical protein
MRTPIAATLAAAFAFALGACASGGRPTMPPAGMLLTGTWTLNEAETRAETPAQADSAPARRPGGMAGGGRRGGGMAGGDRAGAALRRPAPQLVLVQGEHTVTFRFGPKLGVVVPTNGRKTVADWPGAGELELKARWTDAGLRLERRPAGGRGIVEVYSRSPDSPRLIVTTEIAGPRSTRSLRRVYDAAVG